MTPIDLMLAHRSIRAYRGDVPDDDLRTAVRAGQAASTSSAIQAYSVIHVRDADTRARLVELTGNQPYVAQGTFLVVCADLRRLDLAAREQGGAIHMTFEGTLLAIVDASLFAQNLALALESMGYGICYIGGLRNDLGAVDDLLGIPDRVLPLYGMCAGVPDQDPGTRPRLPVDAVLHDDRYLSDDEHLARVAEYDETYRTYLTERGATPRTWSEAMAGKYGEVRRPDVARYYRSKG
ncbi:MAG: NADPH-dependent oxidoreductase, partial [Phycisphaerales bacterium]|nr:NADPH-dependent oxidoreductase [Phycisphaerales bacterium]